jgi:Peptidase C10 family/Spi protease inhibitor
MKKQNFFTIFAVIVSVTFMSVGCQKDIAPMSEQPTEQVALRTGIVPITVAHDIAEHFFSTNSAGKQADKEISTEETLSEDNQPYIYVYNFKGGGFLLVSAEYGDIPILAYSDKNPFVVEKGKEISMGLAIWLGDVRTRIQRIRDKPTTAETASQNLWNSYSKHSLKFEMNDSSTLKNVSGVSLRWEDDACENYSWNRTRVNSLLQTEWGQGAGYNNTCPEFTDATNCGRAPTGCTATAMAQVARFHERPLSWGYNSMPNQAPWSCSTEETPLAYLMRQCGRFVNMEYSANSSGAHVYNIPNVFVSWGYSNSMTYSSVGSFYYSGIESNIQAGRPVIFDGYRTQSTFSPWYYFGYVSYSYSNGHAWVSDGMDIMTHQCYSSIHSYSMNWGWDGNFNGFYGQPQPTQERNYQYNMHVLANIHP